MFIWDTRLLTMNHCSLHFFKIHIKKFTHEANLEFFGGRFCDVEF